MLSNMKSQKNVGNIACVGGNEERELAGGKESFPTSPAGSPHCSLWVSAPLSNCDH